jgi:hypothetical protein
MRQVMQREVSGVTVRLLLPSDGAIVTGAAEHARTISSFGDLDAHGGLIRSLTVAVPCQG